jgi:TolA-binding protein
MRKQIALLFSLVSLLTSLSAKIPEGASLEESLQLRKIAEYWKENDFKTVKIQILDFLGKNPKSGYADQLHAMLGDLYFQDKNYAEAASAYDQIRGKEFRQKTQFRHLHSLYQEEKYDTFLPLSDLFLSDPNAKADEINTVHFERGEIFFTTAYRKEDEVQKKELMKSALAEYQLLMQTKYSDSTLLPQAQIFAFFGEHSKAASLFMLLSHKEENKKEDYLFQAAAMQLHFDKGKAIETFGAICELGGKTASKAAFNQLNLLFQEKRYHDFILAYEKASKYLSQEKTPVMQYFLGKSLYFTQDYARAAAPLLECLASKALDRAGEKSALVTLIACSRELPDLVLFEKALTTLKAEFSHDEETTNILLMHLQLCRANKEWSKARSDIREILDLTPDHPQKEALLYDYALILLQEEKWQESASAFDSFIKSFPQSSYRANALRQIVNCRIEDMKQGPVETARIKKQQLLSVLNQVSEEEKIFSSSEKQKMRYLLGKTQFEIGDYEEAIGNLSEYVKDFSKDPTCADAYLLLAYAHYKGERDEMHFALNAEKALLLNPHMQGAVDLHLTLFNMYLGLAEKASGDEKAERIELAAEHLFLGLDKPAKEENQRWLASYYFQQYKNGNNTAIERSIIVLEKLLGIKEGDFPLSIKEHPLEKEGEALKLAELYRKTGRSKQQVKLLETLAKAHDSHPEYPWKYQRMAQFELGKAYLGAGEKEKAKKNFEELILSSTHSSSYFALAAILEKAKLDFSSLKKTDRHEASEAALAICNALKDVHIQRKLHSEPLHFEAALCYAEYKSALAPLPEQNERMAFLLSQLRDHYFDAEDPLVQHYFSAAQQFPEKDQLCRQYLAFVDLEIMRLQAQKTNDPQLLDKTKEKLNHLLTEANEEKLKQRITEALDKLL